MSQVIKDEAFLPMATSLVANAESNIHISSFKVELTTKRRGLQLIQFFDILRKKHKAGLDVRMLTNKRDNRGHVPESNAYALRWFKQNRIPVRSLRNDRVVHAKLLLIDGRYAIVGSHNLSVRSCHNNFEISFLILDDERLRLLDHIYQNLWDQAKD